MGHDRKTMGNGYSMGRTCVIDNVIGKVGTTSKKGCTSSESDDARPLGGVTFAVGAIA